MRMEFVLYEWIGKRMDVVILTEEEAREYLSNSDIDEAVDQLYCRNADEASFWVDTENCEKALLVCKK